MRVLIDTNVVLDFLLDRDPFGENAAKLFEKIDVGEVEGLIAATTVTNIYYIVRLKQGLLCYIRQKLVQSNILLKMSSDSFIHWVHHCQSLRNKGYVRSRQRNDLDYHC